LEFGMSFLRKQRAGTHGLRTDGTVVERPLSPHLQTYDMLQLTSSMSISHRITGIAWVFGLVMLVWWLVAAAAGDAAFAQVQWFLTSWLGLFGQVLMTAALWYHTLNGVRHLAWDAGFGFAMPAVYRTGHAVLVGTVILTALTWIIAISSWR